MQNDKMNLDSHDSVLNIKITDVAVGVIERPDGTILFGQRPEGKPWSGWWELPGGKLEPGESSTEALARELKEEIGITVTKSRPWVTRVHHYPTTTVRLAFHRVTAWHGEPQGLENQALNWLTPAQALETDHLLPATYPPLKWLSFPELYAFTSVSKGFSDEQLKTPEGSDVSDAHQSLKHSTTDQIQTFVSKLENALSHGIKLVQWREPGWSNHDPLHHQAFEAALNRCRAAQARLMVNSIHPQAWWQQADGVHLRQIDAVALQARPHLSDQHWVGVSAHNLAELNHALKIDADFVTLSPVLPTDSHPGAPHLGWHAFDTLRTQAGVPVFALGGLAPNDLVIAQRFGGHGVAGIGQFLV
jgi:8-oxo-dGTP diphosphatase